MRLIASISVTLACVVGSSHAIEPVPGFLTGRVVSAGGAPIPEATVGYAAGSDGRPVTATTDAAGRFKLGPLPPKAPSRNGCPDLYADAPNFARQYVRTPAVVPGAENDIGDVRLEPGVTFTGTVRDEANKPLAGAVVQIQPGRPGGDWTTHTGPPITVRVDADGRYETPPLPVGGHYFEFRAANREYWNEFVEVRPDSDGKVPTVVLEQELPARGTIVDDRGRPIEGAAVGDRPIDRGGARTDRDGRYVVHGYGQRGATNELTIRKTGFAPGRVGVAAKDPTVELTPLGGFAGRAVDADDGSRVPVWYAKLERVERATDGTIIPRGRVEAQTAYAEPGRYHVYAPGLGLFRLSLVARGYSDSEWVMLPTLTDRRTTDGPVVKLKKIDPATQPRVEGVAERAGKPIASGLAVLYTLSERSAIQVVRGRTTPAFWQAIAEVPVREGRFTLPAPRPGPGYIVGLYEANRPPTFLADVEVKAGRATPEKLTVGETGSVAGIVPSWPPGWQPHLWVVAFDKWGYAAESPVAADGSFHFPALPPGEYGLKVGHDGFRDGDRSPRPGIVQPADPWKRAARVSIKPDQKLPRITLEVPEN